MIALVTLLRVLLAVFGGYAFSAALTAALTVGLWSTGILPRSEAVTLGALLGFLIYLATLLWAFAQRRLLRMALVLGGGALAGYAIAHYLPTLERLVTLRGA